MNQITNKQNGSIDFGFLKYSLADLKNADGTIQNSKEFTYKVSEIIPAEGEKGVSCHCRERQRNDQKMTGGKSQAACASKSASVLRTR